MTELKSARLSALQARLRPLNMGIMVPESQSSDDYESLTGAHDCGGMHTGSENSVMRTLSACVDKGSFADLKVLNTPSSSRDLLHSSSSADFAQLLSGGAAMA